MVAGIVALTVISALPVLVVIGARGGRGAGLASACAVLWCAAFWFAVFAVACTAA